MWGPPGSRAIGYHPSPMANGLPEGPLLGVWAHPDDETYLSAGLMAASVAGGSRVVCVTATRGEEGSLDHDRWPPSEMGRVREAELLASLAVLGVDEHIWLDYRDGTCAGVDPEEGIRRVQAIIEDVRPRSVFTFGPDGMTGHPDHRSVSAWTGEAFARAAAPGSRLYHATMPPDWVERFAPRFEPFNVFMEPGTPPSTARQDLAVEFTLPPDILALKLKAIEAHESQVEGMLRALGDDFFGEAHREEFFRLAAER